MGLLALPVSVGKPQASHCPQRCIYNNMLLFASTANIPVSVYRGQGAQVRFMHTLLQVFVRSFFICI